MYFAKTLVLLLSTLTAVTSALVISTSEGPREIPNPPTGWKSGIDIAISDMCRNLVGARRGMFVGDKITGTVMYESEKNKLRANIYCNNAKAFVTRAQCQRVLKHIADKYTRTDRSEGRPWIYGGTTTTDDGKFTTELWYDKP
ncbi:hypothetical protein BDD12DRAFT_912497 [Trichophaea hybrida]|nr:hypothetical protein BDD12DRAFT_912497 [Trichophaea hybrida]